MDKKGSPIFMKMKEQGHGFIRKNKAGKVVSGIVLGATMFMAGQVASADEVKAPTDAKPVATATTETPKATTTEAPKQEVQAETKEAPKTEEVKDQAGLDKKYSDLKEKGKELDVELKEDKKVTHKTVADASKDLDEQGKKVEEVAKGRDEANAELQKVVKEAKALGIDVKLDDKVTYDDLDKAKEDIANQVKELSALVTSVKEGKARLDKAVSTAQSVGVKFEGVKNIDLKEVADAEKTLNEVASQQKTVSAELNKAIADAKAKGVNVTVEGEVVVDAKDAQKALADAKAKIDKALADAEAKNKTIRENNAKVNEANKNAKAELVSGSTATKNADGTYTQTLAVKNEKAGSKWSGNLANTGSAEIVSVKLVSPSGKETVFANGKIDSSKVLDEVGEYKLVYTFKAKDNNAGNVLGKLSVEGQAGQTGKVTGSLAFATKTKNAVASEAKPRNFLIAIDGSGSTGGGVKKQILEDLTTVAESMNEQDKAMLAFYETNNSNSYYTTGADDRDRPVSRLMTKKELLDILEVVKPNKNNNFIAGVWRNDLAKYKLNYDFKGKQGSQEFENLFDEVRDKSATAIVLQLTDDWKMPDETFDGTIADWAKQHAKTFMSIVYGGADSRANQEMVKAGHPNIYLAKPDGNLIPNDVRSQKIKEQIASTTVEKVTKGEMQTVKVTVGGNGVTVTKATLKGATNKDIVVKDGKVDFNEKLADGNYTLEFEVTGNGTVTTVVTIDGKEVTKKSAEIKGTAGSNGSSSAKEDKLQPSKLGSTTNEVKPEAVKVAKITLKAQKPQVAKVEAKAHEVGVSAKVHPVDVEQKPEVKPVVKQTAKVLPSTGSTASVALVMAGVGMLSLAGASLKKKKD
jgi:putative cross-wall-targeting lipoprotein signal